MDKGKFVKTFDKRTNHFTIYHFRICIVFRRKCKVIQGDGTLRESLYNKSQNRLRFWKIHYWFFNNNSENPFQRVDKRCQTKIDKEDGTILKYNLFHIVPLAFSIYIRDRNFSNFNKNLRFPFMSCASLT